MKNFLRALTAVVLAAVVVAVSFIGYQPRDVYDAAIEAMKEGDYEMARSHLERLDSDAAAGLLSELYFVPYRVTTTCADGTTQLQSYAYNRKGSLVKAELTENEEVVTTSSYTYTDTGAMLTMTVMLPEGTTPETEVECLYDERGNLTCYRTVGDEGLFYQTQYTYDDANRCTASFYVNGNGAWERVEYAYDEAGRLTSEKTTTNEQDQGSFSRYEYYEDGTVKTERLSGPEGLTVRTYNPDGSVLTAETVELEGGRETETYTYDAQGLLAQVAYSSGRRITYNYDKSGRMVYSRDQVSAEKWVETVQEYEDGHLVRRQVNDSDREIYTEVYKYNKKDWCTSYQYKNDSTGLWYQYTYTYDRHGNVETETYKAETGNYQRTYKWKTRHYPSGIPQIVGNILEEYLVKNG